MYSCFWLTKKKKKNIAVLKLTHQITVTKCLIYLIFKRSREVIKYITEKTIVYKLYPTDIFHFILQLDERVSFTYVSPAFRWSSWRTHSCGRVVSVCAFLLRLPCLHSGSYNTSLMSHILVWRSVQPSFPQYGFHYVFTSVVRITCFVLVVMVSKLIAAWHMYCFSIYIMLNSPPPPIASTT